MAPPSSRRSTRAAAVSKPQKPAPSPVKARPTRQSVVKAPNYLDEVKIEDDSEEEEDIALSDDELSVSSSTSSTIKSDESISIDSSEDEDDREIQRIIEKTAAETQNIPKTARQRAKTAAESEVEGEEELLSLPMTKALTDEQILKKSEKSRRRKMQRELKLEETKRATIERLLTKQRGSADKPSEEFSESSPEMQTTQEKGSNFISDGFVRYIDRSQETLLIVPEGSELFVTSIPKAVKSSVPSCSVCKTTFAPYKHPKSFQPFCSVSCFKNIK